MGLKHPMTQRGYGMTLAWQYPCQVGACGWHGAFAPQRGWHVCCPKGPHIPAKWRSKTEGPKQKALYRLVEGLTLLPASECPGATWANIAKGGPLSQVTMTSHSARIALGAVAVLTETTVALVVWSMCTLFVPLVTARTGVATWTTTRILYWFTHLALPVGPRSSDPFPPRPLVSFVCRTTRSTQADEGSTQHQAPTRAGPWRVCSGPNP